MADCPFVLGLTAAEIEETVKEIKADTIAVYDEVAGLPLDGGALTWANTMDRLLTAPNFKTSPRLMSAKFMGQVHPDEAVRKAALGAQTELSKFRVECFLREDVYDRLKAFASSPAAQALSEAQQYQLKEAMRSFEV